MTDISLAIKAKSDQLNAVDLIGAEPVIRIRKSDYNPSREQPLWLYYDGDNNRPWKPSKGMIRVLVTAYGLDDQNFIGKKVQLYTEPSVKFGSDEVGGIQIRALSDITEKGITCAHRKNRHKTVSYFVPLLAINSKAYPDDKFKAALPAMAAQMAERKMTLQQVIAQCQKTGTLTKEQLEQLEKAAPVEIEQSEESEEEVY
jgi:hypothetical protein